MSTNSASQFALPLRLLHWLMAALLVAMLFIGVSMVASLRHYHGLLALHRPLGILVLILALIRLATRLTTRTPAFPRDMRPAERLAAMASERLLYTLFIALPLVGWAMLSAGSYPVVLFGGVHLPAILPAKPALYAALRQAHTVLAYLLFLALFAHIAAILFHSVVLRDGILKRMSPRTVHPTEDRI